MNYLNRIRDLFSINFPAPHGLQEINKFLIRKKITFNFNVENHDYKTSLYVDCSIAIRIH